VSQIQASKIFALNGRRVSLAAGIKAGNPVVVLGVEILNHPAIRDIAVDYAMPNIGRAISFVEQATEDVAARGMADCDAKFGGAIEAISLAFTDRHQRPTSSRINLYKEYQ